MNFHHLAHLIAFLLLGWTTLYGQSQMVNHRFQVIERTTHPETSEAQDRYHYIFGTERTNNSLNRLSMLSEDQSDYPIPESSCGPTAMLNILVWYEKFGLISPVSRAADTSRYKLDLFNEIDRRISEKSGRERTEVIGTSPHDAIIVMDDLVNELSDGKLRMHSKTVSPPLKLSDFQTIMPNFRSGYLIVKSRDPKTRLVADVTHAVTFIRADRAGYITLGTWGKVYRGILRKKGAQQWFIPTNPEHRDLQIVHLVQFIPFEPTTPASR